MYGLPVDIDLSPLLGQELQQICIGQYDAILNFSGEASVGSATTFVCSSPNGETSAFTSPPAATPSLMRVLGSPVVAARREAPGTLVLEFANGERLDIPDAEEHYESYTLQIGSALYVI